MEWTMSVDAFGADLDADDMRAWSADLLTGLPRVEL
jgi:hypothetical protein